MFKIKYTQFKEAIIVFVVSFLIYIIGCFYDNESLKESTLYFGGITSGISLLQFLIYYYHHHRNQLVFASSDILVFKINEVRKEIKRSDVEKVEWVTGRKDVDKPIYTFAFAAPYYFNFITKDEVFRITCLRLDRGQALLNGFEVEQCSPVFCALPIFLNK